MEPSARPSRNTDSIAENEYTVLPNDSTRIRNHTTSKPSAAIPLPKATHSGHDSGRASGGDGSGDEDASPDSGSGAGEKAPLRGKSFVITGTLPSLSRQQVREFIVNQGGVVRSSVSAQTDFLVAGENPGSKLEKAQELGVPVITEEQLRAVVEGRLSLS